MLNKIKKLTKKIPAKGDLIYTVGATMLLQFCMQIVLYPLINKIKGAEFTGDVLFYIGIIYIVPQAIASSMSNIRLVSRKVLDDINGEFVPLVGVLSVISGFICFIITLFFNCSLSFSLVYGLYAIIYTVRVYLQVEYRLTLRFKQYFINYVILSLGYMVGFVVFLYVPYWLIIFIVGEVFATVHSLTQTKIKSYSISKDSIRYIIRNTMIVMIAILIRDSVNQFDKVILKIMVSSETVTKFNALSLIGKSIQMLVGPINTLMLTYLSAKDKKISAPTLKKMIKVTIVMGIAAMAACEILTPIYAYLFYGISVAEGLSFGFFINLELIMGFIASIYVITVLSQGRTKIYSAIQTVWGVLSLLLTLLFTYLFGIYGIVIAMIITNLLKMVVSYREVKKTCEEDT